MKIAIIADDLTGACDTGVQLVNFDLEVAVAIQSKKKLQADAIIYNTDSRSMEKQEAYLKVKEISQEIKKESFDIIYKKIDSTMRGNIGSELNALYDEFMPDFIFITPAHPGNGRIVQDGVHYLHGKELSKTEAAKDPKTPVNESNITNIIQRDAEKTVKHLNYKDLRKGYKSLLKLLEDWKKQGIHYITMDAILEEDFKTIIQLFQSEFSVILCGSAGLMNHIPDNLGYKLKKRKNELSYDYSPALFVVGSISEMGRKQLNHLIENTNVLKVELDAVEVIKGGIKKDIEIEKMSADIKTAVKEGKSVVCYSSDNVEETKVIGEEKGISAIDISNIISEELGNLSVSAIKENNIKNLFLTGGDTAQQVFAKLGVQSYQLLGELELGVPVGKIDDVCMLNTITKAGNFGTVEVMTKAFQLFQREERKAENR
ncbi:four-carbon acid sugar kinase family protein [Oceanobacillus jeddahense]|uniref:Four-carbon acid sugar kinase family protein n=1 Tax=Oceanobacillus jeddahense TaxID=1462527 RepID=A0ABY5JS64_9BACI|nr:four-carbon acid sugar kinase family protein [Oceanobacillus jeddahense]UUI02971.1 hypothetical protein NP439_23570 [Oceanobacillus jeddahense]